MVVPIHHVTGHCANPLRYKGVELYNYSERGKALGLPSGGPPRPLRGAAMLH